MQCRYGNPSPFFSGVNITSSEGESLQKLKLQRTEIKGDGRCILHCFAKEFGMTTNDVAHELLADVEKNADEYILYSDRLTPKELITEFIIYAVSNKFDLNSVDLALEILSKKFNCQLLIYDFSENTLLCRSKIGKKYDRAIKLLRKGGHFSLLHDVKGNNSRMK